MTDLIYEIRLCLSCGLRYPLTGGHSFGIRCPSCLGETKVVIREQLGREVSLDEEKLPEEIKLRVLLDNIRSGWSVGSILRSSDGFGVEHAYLGGITPDPKQAEVQKTALGAEKFITWSVHPNGLEQVVELREAGWHILALEKMNRSIPIQAALQWIIQRPTVLVIGNEICGVDPDILALADRVVHIPMHGKKGSFNVAVAFAVAVAMIHNEIINLHRSAIDHDVRLDQ